MARPERRRRTDVDDLHALEFGGGEGRPEPAPGRGRWAGQVQLLHSPEVRRPVGHLVGLRGDEFLAAHREERVRRPLVADGRERQVADPHAADRTGAVRRADDRAIGKREELVVERVEERGGVGGRIVAHQVRPADGAHEESIPREDRERTVPVVQDERQGLGGVAGGLEHLERDLADLDTVAVADGPAVREGGARPVVDGRARAKSELGRTDEVVLVPVRLEDAGDLHLARGCMLEVDSTVATGVDHGRLAAVADEVGVVGKPLGSDGLDEHTHSAARPGAWCRALKFTRMILRLSLDHRHRSPQC